MFPERERSEQLLTSVSASSVFSSTQSCGRNWTVETESYVLLWPLEGGREKWPQSLIRLHYGGEQLHQGFVQILTDLSPP